VADDDFLDLDLPTAPPPIAVKRAAEEAEAKAAAGKGKTLKQSDEWSLDLDILPEGDDAGGKTPEPASPQVSEGRLQTLKSFVLSKQM
jgi:hypothetical protein